MRKRHNRLFYFRFNALGQDSPPNPQHTHARTHTLARAHTRSPQLMKLFCKNRPEQLQDI